MSPSFPLRKELFDEAAVKDMRARYLESEPYHHLVIPDLVEEGLLEKTKEELKCGVQATLKETDIYKVYQTGDLANLDGLSKEEKDQLQSLRQLRDALYSVEFRKLVSKWTGTGPLSGSNIDLSVNAYGHTGHLLCHDDVIGTRKVSYILYLVDSSWDAGEKPDGGALQLYPADAPGVPSFAPSKSIPPRWNQMVLFGVAPGKSFHDVQEVFSEEVPRLAISGWFHRANEDEMDQWSESDIKQGHLHDAAYDGAQSSLSQLEDKSGSGLSSSGPPGKFEHFAGDGDIDLSLWISKDYLQDGAQTQCAAAFEENGSTVQLHRFLREDVASRILAAVRLSDERDHLGYMEASPFDIGVGRGWEPVGPPHRHSEGSSSVDGSGDDDVAALMRQLRAVFASTSFRDLLQRLTGLRFTAQRAQARRFRPGLDYSLALPPSWDCQDPDDMILDAVLCFVDDVEPYKEAAWQQDEVGGYQTYLGGDDQVEGKGEVDAGNEGNGDGVSTGSAAQDAAIYQADEGGNLISVSAAFNALSLVLRDDAEVLSFVKYVSSAAPGSRYDLSSEFVVDGTDDESPAAVAEHQAKRLKGES